MFRYLITLLVIFSYVQISSANDEYNAQMWNRPKL